MKGLAVVVAIALVCAAALSRAGERAIEPAPPPAPQSLDVAQIRLGARLAAVGDCIVCHSAPDGRSPLSTRTDLSNRACPNR